MKKTLIISVIALTFSIGSVSAATVKESISFTGSQLDLAVNPSPFCMSIIKGDIVTVKKLLQLGVSVNEKSNGMTPAMYAAKFNRVNILKLLIDNGANLKTRSDKGMRAVEYAELSNAADAKALIESTLKE
ncbi:ankyrin repeat domain-containing protein [Lacinutrix neustonica]|uniref:Ankyrin repeat domain-containing protein n=1 Tax=Lacinutrix neustonica TaxID=2980107 RepID=A0A9E8SDR2_9FLAO|nr:ankyrin repeat domain-containing protein [Lacinutrix neustonica]WAC01489.1 ankyrin repeat domain-containing protein [Lacinutrix neustonica]